MMQKFERYSGLRMASGALLAVCLSGCAAQVHVPGGGAGPLIAQPVKLVAGSVRADLNVVGDATQIQKESASDSFAAAHMTCARRGAPCATVDLRETFDTPASSFRHAAPPVRV